MDDKENIQTAGMGERKPGRNWKESKLIFIVLPIMLMILYPVGGLDYLCGRFSLYVIILVYVSMLYLAIVCFIIFCFFTSIVRLFRDWKKSSGKKKSLIVAEFVIPLLFIIPFFIPNDSDMCWFFYKPFAYGFRDRIRNKADVEAIRNWVGTLNEKYFRINHSTLIPSDEWPKSLRVLNPRRIIPVIDENGNRKIKLSWGAFIGHWGVDIGMRNMKTPPSDFRHYGVYILPLEPGVYVWNELQ
jgi:hypothetical protein